MVGQAFISQLDNTVMQEKNCFFIPTFGLFYPKSQIAGDSYNVEGTVCSFFCPVLCCLGAVSLTESGREPCNSVT